jgi:hypothetical protein
MGIIITPILIVVTGLFLLAPLFALFFTPILGILVALSLFIPI